MLTQFPNSQNCILFELMMISIPGKMQLLRSNTRTKRKYSCKNFTNMIQHKLIGCYLYSVVKVKKKQKKSTWYSNLKNQNIPSLWSLKPWIMHAHTHGLPARDAFAPPLSSPLCCFRLHRKFQFVKMNINQTCLIMKNTVPCTLASMNKRKSPQGKNLYLRLKNTL